jgi:hypothetical protein
MNRHVTLILGLLILTLFFSISSIKAVLWSSPEMQFNVTPETLYINWTNGGKSNITIGINSSFTSIQVAIHNSTTSVKANYSQPQPEVGWYSGKQYPGYCFGGILKYYFRVQNATGDYVNVTTSLVGGSTTDMTIIDVLNDCPPGRYWGILNITNATNINEYVDLNVIIDKPITSTNELNTSTGIGQFRGILPANAKTYHSYYFNTSEVDNATSVMVNLSWADTTQDVDLFLLDLSGNLKAKSINTSTTEELYYNYLPENEIWEIRLYGNSTSIINYTSGGFIVFSTLNATNSSNQNQQFSLIDFGKKNPGGSARINVTLKNEGSLTLTNVQESKKIYYIEYHDASTAPKNFTFIIPEFATEIRASINWTGASNYTISLYRPDKTLVGTSANKHVNANVTNVMQEEFVEYSTTVGDDEGIWIIEVKNTTAVNFDPYTVILKFWLNANEWISSNYTQMTFNPVGQTNSTQDFHFNFTIPEKVMNGLYEGSLGYRSASGSVLEIPFKVNVTTAMLMVNNTLNSSTVQLNENIGFNLTKELRIPITNNGSLPITFEQDANSTSLNHGNYYINFSYVYPSSLATGASDTLNITINIDTTKTQNRVGTYEGWIFLNATESSPYKGFNLTLKIRLTNELDVDIIDIDTADGDDWIEDASNSEKVMLHTKVFYINGTEMTDLDIANFTSSWIVEATSGTNYKYPTSGSLSISSGTTPLYDTVTSKYYVNITVPSGLPGGNYTVYLNVNSYRNNVNLVGTGYNSGVLKINNTGLKLTAITSEPFSMNELSTKYYNVSIKNYGYIKATGNLSFIGCSNYLTVDAYSVTSGCGSAQDGYFTLDVDANLAEECVFVWKLTAANVTGDKSCIASIETTSPAYGNITGIDLTIKDTDVTTEAVEEAGEEEGVTTTTTVPAGEAPVYLNITSYPTLVKIQQGKSKTETIVVKNINNTISQNVTLTIENIDSSWYTITPSEVFYWLQVNQRIILLSLQYQLKQR